MIRAAELFSQMGLDPDLTDGDGRDVQTPIDGSVIGSVMDTDPVVLDDSIGLALRAFEHWRDVPAPQRATSCAGTARSLRTHKEALGTLVSLEAGKILSEGRGEVQEMIDICDFAVGLSRQLYGKTIASERPGHRLMELWHPIGADRRHHRVQLPGGGVVVEHGASAWCAATPSCGSRRRRRRSPPWPAPRSSASCLEDEPALHGLAQVVTRRPQPGPGAHATTSASRWSAPPAARGWAGRSGPRVRGPLRSQPAGARRQQRHDRGALGRPRPGPAGRSCSPPSARRGSAARRCAGSSPIVPCTTSWSSRSPRPTPASPSATRSRRARSWAR